MFESLACVTFRSRKFVSITDTILTIVLRENDNTYSRIKKVESNNITIPIFIFMA